jgi:hypothetical protein
MRLEYDECSMMTRKNVIKKRTHFGNAGRLPGPGSGRHGFAQVPEAM